MILAKLQKITRMPFVSGKVIIKEKPVKEQTGIIYIRLIDASKIDVSSIKVKEIVDTDISVIAVYEKGFSFRMEIDDINPKVRYEIAVFIDLEKSGKKSKGDYITKQSYPVLTKGYPDYVEVEVSVI